MKRRMNIATMKSKMQSAARHLASLCPSRFFIHHSSHSSLFIIHYSLFILLLISCYREPLELYIKGDSEIQVTYNFTKYRYRTNGLSMMYAWNGDSITESYATHDTIMENRDDMPNGFYKMIIMTNTFQEYEGNMKFYNTRYFDKMYATSETYNITDQNAWDKGMRYMEEPMKMAVAIDSFEVNMDNDGHIFYEYDRGSDADTLRQKKEVTMMPMTTTLTIRVKVVGINYMLAPSLGGVEGYITGLAEGFDFSTQWRRKEVGNIKLKNWRSYYSSSGSRQLTTDGNRKAPSEAKTGWIETTIETFGLPHGRELLSQRTEASNYIKLHFTMLDNKTIDFSYNVGKMIKYKGDDGTMETFTQADIALELDLEIDAPFINEDDLPTLPYAQPSGTGAFDAEVQPWGDEQDVDVPM
jgi:hypothetical protein